MGWDREFGEQILLPKGKKLTTLRDARCTSPNSPRQNTTLTNGQAAMEALILVATLGGPTMFARIGIVRALNRHVEREFNPPRKDPHWVKRKLTRDE
jgi:hypothetical protein